MKLFDKKYIMRGCNNIKLLNLNFLNFKYKLKQKKKSIITSVRFGVAFPNK